MIRAGFICDAGCGWISTTRTRFHDVSIRAGVICDIGCGWWSIMQRETYAVNMITVEETAQLVADGESETVEFKATTGQRTEAARSLSAMLNGGGGRALFGVLPGGRIVGQQTAGRC